MHPNIVWPKNEPIFGVFDFIFIWAAFFFFKVTALDVNIFFMVAFLFSIITSLLRKMQLEPIIMILLHNFTISMYKWVKQ